eukprot:NODE_57_length_3661_cov_23.453594_g53_i0.p1 GENE.NODE_57_length_3661_cov_23.453594_g53_i0~~NODE_57_length_3661_cov_23.453594_g53_i0.p1  ORF type:complete len:748 (+),score=90.45 NODE_57_length_3661_cov_23.453594_g53_i0:1253-3496(+)
MDVLDHLLLCADRLDWHAFSGTNYLIDLILCRSLLGVKNIPKVVNLPLFPSQGTLVSLQELMFVKDEPFAELLFEFPVRCVRAVVFKQVRPHLHLSSCLEVLTKFQRQISNLPDLGGALLDIVLEKSNPNEIVALSALKLLPEGRCISSLWNCQDDLVMHCVCPNDLASHYISLGHLNKLKLMLKNSTTHLFELITNFPPSTHTSDIWAKKFLSLLLQSLRQCDIPQLKLSGFSDQPVIPFNGAWFPPCSVYSAVYLVNLTSAPVCAGVPASAQSLFIETPPLHLVAEQLVLGIKKLDKNSFERVCAFLNRTIAPDSPESKLLRTKQCVRVNEGEWHFPHSINPTLRGPCAGFYPLPIFMREFSNLLKALGIADKIQSDLRPFENPLVTRLMADQRFCDLTIQAKGLVLFGHQAVWCTGCTAAVWLMEKEPKSQSNTGERKKQTSVPSCILDLPQCSGAAIEIVHTFLYSGRVNVDPESEIAYDVLEAAEILGVPYLQHYMSDLLQGWIPTKPFASVPRTWKNQTPASTFCQRVDCPVTDPSYQFIAQALQNTHCNKGAKVLMVRRIENSCLWKLYCRSREDFRDRNTLHSLKVSRITGGSNCLRELSRENHLDQDTNELYLFHGTKRNVVDLIVEQGFDERVAKNGLYGAGIYFAQDACKSFQYADNTGGSCFMFCCRVTMGEPFITTGRHENLRRPPTRPNKKILFDSVLADPKKANSGNQIHREFIIYDRCLTYPEFLVEYTSA